MPRVANAELTQTEPTQVSAETGLWSRCDPVLLGTWFGILSAVAYAGANVALREVATPGDVGWAAWVSCLKAVPAAVVAWILIGYRAFHGLRALPPVRLVVPLLLTGLLMQFGGNVMFQWALGLGGLALTVPLNFAALILSGAWLGRFYLAEAITPRSAAAMGTLIVSMFFLGAGADDVAHSVAGVVKSWMVLAAIAAACMAGVAYGICGVVIRRTVTSDVSLSATLVLLSTSGVIGLGLWSLFQLGAERLWNTSARDLQTMLWAGILNAVAFFALSAALKYTTINRVNLLNASQIAMCALAGVALFGEQMTGWLIAGTALTMLGLFLMDHPPKRKPDLNRQAASSTFDVQRIQTETFVRKIDFHPQLASTNDRGLELAQKTGLESPLLVLAERQTAGRGRGTNRWWSEEGALTFSLVLRAARTPGDGKPHPGEWGLNLPVDQWPRLSLTAGLAVCEALGELLPGAQIGLKWPNDVFLNGRKVCGILVEVPELTSGHIVLGIGINVNNSPAADVANGLVKAATSLRDVSGEAYDLTEVLIRVLNHFARELDLLCRGGADLSRRWQEYCLLEGRRVELDAGARRVRGVCQGLGADGALLLRTAAGLERFHSGVVVHFE